MNPFQNKQFAMAMRNQQNLFLIWQWLLQRIFYRRNVNKKGSQPKSVIQHLKPGDHFSCKSYFVQNKGQNKANAP